MNAQIETQIDPKLPEPDFDTMSKAPRNRVKWVKTPVEARVIAAVKDAFDTAHLSVHKRIIAGQMLREQRAGMLKSHDSMSWNDRTLSDESLFTNWMAQSLHEVCQRTLYRWMNSASRVVAHLMGMHNPNAPVWLELDGSRLFISDALTMPLADCTVSIRAFQDAFLAFLEDKTLAEATACALHDGNDSRIARAANGKLKGGTRGENRRAYAKQAAWKLRQLGRTIARWERLTETDFAQASEMLAEIERIVLKDGIVVRRKGRDPEFKGWPRKFRDVMFAALKRSFEADLEKTQAE